MPSNVRTTRPDQATGLRHIGDPANALISRLNATQHPNVVRMHDRIDAWVKEANRRGGAAGIEYLAVCAARIEENRQNLADYATDRGDLRRGMDGVTVFDLDAADARISRAADVLTDEPMTGPEPDAEGIAAAKANADGYSFRADYAEGAA